MVEDCGTTVLAFTEQEKTRLPLTAVGRVILADHENERDEQGVAQQRWRGHGKPQRLPPAYEVAGATQLQLIIAT